MPTAPTMSNVLGIEIAGMNAERDWVRMAYLRKTRIMASDSALLTCARVASTNARSS